MDYRLTYLNAPVTLLDQPGIQAIMATNTALSDELGLTGLFIYLNGASLEISEGALEKLNTYFDIIKGYDWHSQLVALGKRPIDARFFTRYVTAYKVFQASDLDQLTSLVNNPALRVRSSEADQLLLSLINSFYSTNINN